LAYWILDSFFFFIFSTIFTFNSSSISNLNYFFFFLSSYLFKCILRSFIISWILFIPKGSLRLSYFYFNFANFSVLFCYSINLYSFNNYISISYFLFISNSSLYYFYLSLKVMFQNPIFFCSSFFSSGITYISYISFAYSII